MCHREKKRESRDNRRGRGGEAVAAAAAFAGTESGDIVKLLVEAPLALRSADEADVRVAGCAVRPAPKKLGVNAGKFAGGKKKDECLKKVEKINAWKSRWGSTTAGSFK